VSDKAMEYGNILMELFMRENLKMTLKLVKEKRNIKQVKDLKEYLNRVKNMKEFCMTQII
jgi:hypothetical protein